MGRGIADQCTARLERRVQPFMGVERNRIGTLDPGNTMCILGSDGNERADTAVDVKPEVLLSRQFCESLQIIYRPSVYRPGCTYHASGLKTCWSILGNRHAQRGHIDPHVGISRNAS